MKNNFVSTLRLPMPEVNPFPIPENKRNHDSEYNLPTGYAFDDDGGILDLGQNVQAMLAFRDTADSQRKFSNQKLDEPFHYEANNDGWGGEYIARKGNGPLQIEALNLFAKGSTKNESIGNPEDNLRRASIAGAIGGKLLDANLSAGTSDGARMQAGLYGPGLGVEGKASAIYMTDENGMAVPVGIDAEGEIGAFFNKAYAKGELRFDITPVVNRVGALLMEMGRDKGPRHEYDLVLNGEGHAGVGAALGGAFRAGRIDNSKYALKSGVKVGPVGVGGGMELRRKDGPSVKLPIPVADFSVNGRGQ